MTARYPLASLHPATRSSIEANMPKGQLTVCGCHIDLGGMIWLYQYHEGYDDGIEAVTAP